MTTSVSTLISIETPLTPSPILVPTCWRPRQPRTLSKGGQIPNPLKPPYRRPRPLPPTDIPIPPPSNSSPPFWYRQPETPGSRGSGSKGPNGGA
ncbi:hypothetical protein MP228_002830 [Amoeboaphelidium protococcarum]|nr:hypothetical protein MP228_002830 [Amoeboaphelidium protococcarum]